MPVKLRLQRRGRSHKAFYAIVAADSKSPRDGKFIEKIGTYNPNSQPASIDLNFEKALSWIQNGAQPTDTVRAMLSYKGVLMMDHLLRGVKKGAFDETEAQRRFEDWKKQKDSQVKQKTDKIKANKNSALEDALKHEQEVKEKRAEAIKQKLAKAVEQEQAAETSNEEQAENTTEVKTEE